MEGRQVLAVKMHIRRVAKSWCNKVSLALSFWFLLLLVLYCGSVPRQLITEKQYHLIEEKDREIMIKNELLAKGSQQQSSAPGGVHKKSFFANKNDNEIYYKLSNVSDIKVKTSEELKNSVGETVKVVKSEEKIQITADSGSVDTSHRHQHHYHHHSVTAITLSTPADAAITAATTTTTTIITTATSHVLKQQNENHQTRKTILFYTNFFSSSWATFLPKQTLLTPECPVANCDFLFNTSHSHPEDADAVIFHSRDINMKSVPRLRRTNQLYIWLNLEAPSEDDKKRVVLHRLTPQKFKTTQKSLDEEDETCFGRSGFFNWTFTYHRESDLLLLYGGLWPIKGKGNRIQPGLLDTSGDTYKNYVAALDRQDLLLQAQGDTEQQEKQEEDWAAFLERPKLVAWMVSHCSTPSGREFYVRELQQHLKVDVFGKCGELKCGTNHKDLDCYSRVLRPRYKFYLAFENNLCGDYITEKVWLPLHYGLVPVVYGGTRYSEFLPPHSYIDATRLTPLQLARLLIKVGDFPELYGRYHLWRKYWKVLLRPPLCQLCYKLHLRTTNNNTNNKNEEPSKYKDLRAWWRRVNNCTTHYPQDRYPRPPEPDTRPLLQRVADAYRFLKWAGSSVFPAIKPRS